MPHRKMSGPAENVVKNVNVTFRGQDMILNKLVFLKRRRIEPPIQVLGHVITHACHDVSVHRKLNRLFNSLLQVDKKENIEAPHCWCFVRGSHKDRWIPLTKGQ